MKSNSTPWIVIIVLLLILFFQRECSRPEPEVIEVPVYVYERDTVKGDSIPYPVEVAVPGDTVWATDTVLINDGSIPSHIWDIIADYYSVKSYNIVLFDDSSAYFRLDYSLFNNSTKSMDYEFVNKRPVAIICPEAYTPVNKLYIGGGIMGNMNTFGAGPAIALNTKRDNLYTYKYDVINKTHHVTTFWKLSFRK